MLTRALTFPLAGTMLLASAALSQAAEASPSSTTGSTSSISAAFLTQERTGEWRASKLDGLEVYNNNDQRIGEIRELLVDRSGHVDAVVVGVGGFLGFREHDVAVPFDKITWVGVPQSRAGQDMQRAYPKHALLNMTKDQLLTAPEFKYAR